MLVKATCRCSLDREKARERLSKASHPSWLYCDKHGCVRDPNIGADGNPIQKEG